MDRHDSTAQAPLEPIPPDQFSLSRVRPGLLRFSRMVRADFKVRSIPQVMEVQFSQHRLREQLATSVPECEQPENIALYALVALSTIVFVGGAVALTGSVVLGLVVAALLPAFHTLVAASKNKFYHRKAILKLTHTPDGYLLLTLITAPKSKSVRPTESSSPPTLHVSQVPVHAIHSGPTITLSDVNLFCHQVSFTLLGPQSRRLNQIRITGSRQEIRWLCRHLERWGQMSRDCKGRSQNVPY